MRDEVKFFVAYVVRGVECRDAWVNRVMGGRPSAARLRAACETQSEVGTVQTPDGFVWHLFDGGDGSDGEV